MAEETADVNELLAGGVGEDELVDQLRSGSPSEPAADVRTSPSSTVRAARATKSARKRRR